MIFDKAQAMRNAERYVSQNNIRAAIEEYKQVVAHDPKDVVTLNMLGDLYAKDSNKAQAVSCYKKVAEHYGQQGFSQKAIAVYKKITKLEPNSVEVSGKLAELYQTKGSVSEARSHFTTLAEHYLEQGRKTEALAIWKQIAILDPNDLEVFPKVAEACLQELGKEDEAAHAYAEAGMRFSKVGRSDAAIDAFSKALAVRPGYLPALNGFVSVKTNLGQAADAAATLEQILAKERYNRDIAALMVECFLGADDLESAERGVIRLVEQEPANYPKLLELVQRYLSKDDCLGAARCLTLCIEHLLLGGKEDEAIKWIDEILAKDGEQLGALKLKVRYLSWKRDDDGLRGALKKLDEVAVRRPSLEDERYALSQLVMVLPQEQSYADRLRVINEKHGFTENLYDEKVLQHQFDDQGELYAEELATGFSFTSDTAASTEFAGDFPAEDILERNGSVASQKSSGGASSTSNKSAFDVDMDTVLAPVAGIEEESLPAEDFGISENAVIEKELESIKFYIESGYGDLAEAALNELAAKYGERPEISAVRAAVATASTQESVSGADPVVEAPASDADPNGSKARRDESSSAKTLDLDEIRVEFGLDEVDSSGDDSDYETHYQMAVAYQEMGLMEDAIKEFQDAISQIGPNDTTRRFFHCANLLGHCFMQKGMAKLALRWFNRALETPGLTADEKKGIWYELGEAHEVDGDNDNAARYFEQVYAEDVDFRDVGNRLQNLVVNA
jgi:tetratricopeptide (TPR) repeat protein